VIANLVRRASAAASALALLFLSSGCTMTHYVTQAAAGQDELQRRAVDIDVLLEGHHVEGRTKKLLSEIAPIKAFGEAHGLRPTPNYTMYVRLDRPAVAWNVSACDPLMFRPKSWSFPIVGSFTALNWFAKKDAEEFAKDLEHHGWDVDMRGLTAYSTAGWFTDPIVSSMFSTGEDARGRLANTVLHESTHATFFVPGQSALNESVAGFVGDKMSALYMEERFGKDSREVVAYLDSEKRGRDRVVKLHEAYQKLDALYRSKATREEKLAKKAEILRALRAEVRFQRPINNATLMGFRTYNSGQEELASLLDACGGSYPRFMATLERLKSRGLGPATGSQTFEIGAAVAALTREGCAPAN
jgi:predicted aminopeptidase